ncbi:MAG: hypothetical protein AAFY41_10645 [Bacteroidota bacterium]
MRYLIIPFFLLVTLSVNAQWKLIYEHDKDGNTVSGSKADLIEAIQNGAEVRLGWKMGSKDRSIQHYAEGTFLSILEGEVFAQINPILSQKPDFENVSITFRENLKWSFIASTTGKNATYFYIYESGDHIDNKSYRWGNQWFVKY